MKAEKGLPTSDFRLPTSEMIDGLDRITKLFNITIAHIKLVKSLRQVSDGVREL